MVLRCRIFFQKNKQQLFGIEPVRLARLLNIFVLLIRGNQAPLCTWKVQKNNPPNKLQYQFYMAS
jgi:hypothetical protein